LILPDVITERGYFTAWTADDLPEAFAAWQRRSGLVIPIRDTRGITRNWQLKADQPRRSGGKLIKYDSASGGFQCLDVPERSRPLLGDPAIPLWITEGSKKVDSGLSNGIPCIVGVMGVYGFRGTNEHNGKVVLADFEDIALNGREVVLAFDSDVMTKSSVRNALDRLSDLLVRRGSRVRYLLLPDFDDGRKCGLDDAFASGLTLTHVEAFIVDHLPLPHEEWPEPIPLDEPEGPPFPLHALPGTIGTYAAAVAAETQTPIDMAGIVILGTISAAVGGRYVVGGSRQGWIEPVHGMFLVVAEPGNRKSAVIRAVTKPIADYERDVQPDERVTFAQWESQIRVLEKALASAETAAGKSSAEDKVTDAEAIRMAAVKTLEAHRATRPRITRIVYDDVTPEAAKSALAEQGGAIAVMSGESAFLSNTAGSRYSDTPNHDVILSGHAADSIRVDRKARPAETIERACLTICVMVQPDVIRELGRSPGFVQRGGAARLLPCLPADNLGRRQIDVACVPADLSKAWSDLVTRILQHVPAMRNGSYVPWTLNLDPEALAEFRTYRLWHESQMTRDGHFGDIRDWAGKECGAVLRIAGLLHIGTHEAPEHVPINADTLRRAITIATYFEQHVRVMYRMMRGRSDQSDARTVLTALEELGTSNTKRELHRKLQDHVAFQKSEHLNKPLQVLEEHGWIRTEREGKSLKIYINPLAGPDNPDNLPDSSQYGRLLSELSGFSLESGTTTPVELHRAPDLLEALDDFDRADVEDLVTELGDGGPAAVNQWRVDVENNLDLTDHERALAALVLDIALRLAGQEAA